jgi:N-acetylmuramoyl-L-alanine amidase
MKKIFLSVLISIILSSNLAANSVSFFAQSRIFYEDTGGLIITHPQENHRVTVSSRMSFLGDSDTNHRLYINGEEIETTKNGFFSYYAELEPGENEFVFENGEETQTIIVTRQEPEEWIAPETIYYQDEVYGEVAEGHNYISRFAYFDDNLNAKTPLVAGTTFRITGERGDFYILADDTAVFKANVNRLEEQIPEYSLSGGEITAQRDSISVSFNVTDNPLYEVILDDRKAALIIYADTDQSELNPVEPYVSEIIKTVQESAIIYEFMFEQKPVGYMVGFADDKINVRFRFPPVSLSEALVLLDAGHGGSDPGAVGPPGELGSMEKDFNLYVAQTAQDYLRQRGVRVVLIRNTDDFVQIMDRVEYFGFEPDISVSVHTNSMPLGADFSSRTGPLMFYTLDLSEQAADDMIGIILSETGNVYDGEGLPHRRQNFAMARYTGAPSMLFEMGFICNPEEYEILLDTAYLDKMGEALGRSVEGYLMQLTGDSGQSEISETQTPLIIREERDEAHPALLQTYSPNSTSPALIRYALFIACVLLIGAVLCLPTAFKKK